MGEAKQREEEGHEGPQKLYGVKDLCPACGKTCHDMDKEHAGKLITMSNGMFIVCWRCGNVFFPQSRIKHLETMATQTIVNPNSPEGIATQQAASKLILPGAGK